MTYSIPTNDVTLFLSELNKIKRNIHQAFRGDGVYNRECVLFELCRNSPVAAAEIANELDVYDTPNNIHPITIKGFAKRIRKNLTSLNA